MNKLAAISLLIPVIANASMVSDVSSNLVNIARHQLEVEMEVMYNATESQAQTVAGELIAKKLDPAVASVIDAGIPCTRAKQDFEGSENALSEQAYANGDWVDVGVSLSELKRFNHLTASYLGYKCAAMTYAKN